MTSKEALIKKKLGSEEAYLEHMRTIAKKAKTTTHGFTNPEVRQKAYEKRWGVGRTPKKRR